MPPVTEEGHLLTGLHVQDIGDLDPGHDIEFGWMTPMQRLAAVPAESFLTVLGGDHCTAISTLSAQMRRPPGLFVLWVDAHPDLCDFSRGGRWTCGCALRRALEASGIEPSRIVIAGGRDYDPEELDFIAKNGVLLVSAVEIARDLPAAAGENAGRPGPPQGNLPFFNHPPPKDLDFPPKTAVRGVRPGETARALRAGGEKIAERRARHKVHVSFDIDALDPAYAPGTEIPSAGGLSSRQALELLRGATERSRLVGFDVVEVSPPFDHGDITTLAALKLIFEVWGMVKSAREAGAYEMRGKR